MNQTSTLSISGMAVKFQYSRVVRTSDLNHNQISRALDSIQPDKIFNLQSIAIVDKINSVSANRRTQKNILKAVLVSDAVYQAALIATPGVVPYIMEMNIGEQFLSFDDRFSRIIPSIAQQQTLKTKLTACDGAGDVIVGTPFVDATLSTKEGLIPTVTDGAAGTASFGVGNANATVTLSFVTQAIHPTVIIKRQEIQNVQPALVIQNETLGVVMNATLAGLLGITLPAY